MISVFEFIYSSIGSYAFIFLFFSLLEDYIIGICAFIYLVLCIIIDKWIHKVNTLIIFKYTNMIRWEKYIYMYDKNRCPIILDWAKTWSSKKKTHWKALFKGLVVVMVKQSQDDVEHWPKGKNNPQHITIQVHDNFSIRLHLMRHKSLPKTNQMVWMPWINLNKTTNKDLSFGRINFQ